jgi:UDP-2,4-diacetamido-2,4,6-trideoxy-beta-L-altropyranose hydrolase
VAVRKAVSRKIAIRVDASVLIGTGHFMRCLTLADALKKLGMEVCFISRHLPQHLGDMLTDSGHSYKKLAPVTETTAPQETSYSNWLGTSQLADAHQTSSALAEEEWDWLIVDHYALDARWETIIRPRVKHILVIDDIADRPHDCDVLLDQNYYPDMDSRYTGKVADHCTLLLGPQYALLRDVFKHLRQDISPRTGKVHAILVFFGGIDLDNCTERAIDALSTVSSAKQKVDVVIGKQHPNRTAIEEKCLHLGFACHVQTERMAELMAAADLAIGAGGSACWERCSLGLPSLLVTVADNQREIVAGLDQLQACLSIGDSAISADTISRHLKKIMDDPELLHTLSKNAYALVDGAGALRVCMEMNS